MKNLIVLLAGFALLSCALPERSNQSTSEQTQAPTPPVASKLATPVNRYIPSRTYRGIDFGATIETIGFGSCANQDAPQPIWKMVEKNNPDIFLFMGDNVYASSPKQQPIAEQYRKLDQIPEYQSIRDKVPFLATWDDHDLGTDDGGADAPTRDSAKIDFLNYWVGVKNSLSMDQINRGGLYYSKMIGPKNKVVQIIMLDTRFYRSILKRANDPTRPYKSFEPNLDKNSTILGAEQWKWLEAQLKRPANLRILVSSIQVIADDHKFEKWGNYPHERERLFTLIKKTNAKNLVIFSGDRHIGTIAKTDIKGWGPIFDITASSINKAKDVREEDKTYVGKMFPGENFGVAHIDWKNKSLKVELRDKDDQIQNSVNFKFAR